MFQKFNLGNEAYVTIIQDVDILDGSRTQLIDLHKCIQEEKTIVISLIESIESINQIVTDEINFVFVLDIITGNQESIFLIILKIRQKTRKSKKHIFAPAPCTFIK